MDELLAGVLQETSKFKIQHPKSESKQYIPKNEFCNKTNKTISTPGDPCFANLSMHPTNQRALHFQKMPKEEEENLGCGGTLKIQIKFFTVSKLL